MTYHAAWVALALGGGEGGVGGRRLRQQLGAMAMLCLCTGALVDGGEAFNLVYGQEAVVF